MKIFLFIFFVLSSFVLKAQNKVIVKYYDTLWVSTTKEKANFYAEFEKIDTAYKFTSYYFPSMKLYGKSFFSDTLFRKGVGIMVRYYESGELKDSTYFNTDGSFYKQVTYYKNGNIYSKVTLDEKKNITTEGFNEKGEPIKIYTVIQIPAEFEGGLAGWTNYLQENLRGNIPARKKAPVGKYVVYVTFIIDEEGRVTNVQAENDPGYGTKEEAIRVISKSPKWKPAVQNGKNVIYRHKQGITFDVSEK